MEFRFLQEPPEVLQCQSPVPSVPTISVTSAQGDDGKAEDVQAVAQNQDEEIGVNLTFDFVCREACLSLR